MISVPQHRYPHVSPGVRAIVVLSSTKTLSEDAQSCCRFHASRICQDATKTRALKYLIPPLALFKKEARDSKYASFTTPFEVTEGAFGSSRQDCHSVGITQSTAVSLLRLHCTSSLLNVQRLIHLQQLTQPHSLRPPFYLDPYRGAEVRKVAVERPVVALLPDVVFKVLEELLRLRQHGFNPHRIGLSSDDHDDTLPQLDPPREPH